jgi:hypothetical protein
MLIQVQGRRYKYLSRCRAEGKYANPGAGQQVQRPFFPISMFANFASGNYLLIMLPIGGTGWLIKLQ